jgi:hypothetical protein
MIDVSHLSLASEHVDVFEGKWHSVDFQPDLTVPQRFVIGVALSRKGKLTHFRIAEDAPKLKCFYGQRYSREVWSWMRDQLTAELAEVKGQTVANFRSVSPQVTIGEGYYASGSDADATLSRTFGRIVTVVGGEKKKRDRGVSQSELRAEIGRILRISMNTRYESLAMPEGGLQINDNGQIHTFDIGYDDNKTASSVVSACYANLDTARLNIMTALHDLYTFIRIRERDQIGLAVLTPSPDNLSGETVKLWQDWWRHESYKLKESHLVLCAESDNTEELANQVSDWYPDPASA